MNRIISILLLSLWFNNSYAQVIAVQADKMNVLYTCIENPITVAVEMVPCSELVVTIDNGKIEKNDWDPPGHYQVWPSHAGQAIISISRKSKNGAIKKLGEQKFRVKQTPVPWVYFNGKHGGEVDAPLFRCGARLTTKISCYDMSPRVTIIGATMVIIRNGQQIFSKQYKDANGVEELVMAEPINGTLKAQDTVLFKDKKLKTCEQEPRDLEDIQFVLK